jgi:TRAP-type C4-dicarboxylate transport system substrate-binding protein
VTLWRYVADPLIFSVNKQVWNSFTPEDQKIVREAALEAGKYGIEVARKGVTPEDPSELENIKKLGVTISELKPEELKAFQDATKPVYDKWKARIGAELVDAAEKAVANRKK